MSLSNRSLSRIAGADIYGRGEKYYRRRMVIITENTDGNVTALVSGSQKKPYEVRVGIGDEKLVYSHCSCPYFADRDGVCKHIVAVVLQAQEGMPVDAKNETLYPAPLLVRSDRNATLLLNNYVKQIIGEADSLTEGAAVLEPILQWDGINPVSLYFRAGEGKLYTIGDLQLFKSRFQHREPYSYGVQFTLVHSVSSFREESRDLLRFFLKNYDNNNYIHAAGNTLYYAHLRSNRRNMYLSPAMADEFFEIMGNVEVSLQDSHRRVHHLPIIRENYRPKMLVRKSDKGALISLDNGFRLIHGNKCLYILTGDRVYCCDSDFYSCCGGLLEAFQKSPEAMFMADRDINMFFSAVLPKIRPYVDLVTEGEFESFTPMPLVTKIYLDAPDMDSITSRMTFTYGEQTMPAYEKKDFSVTQNLTGEVMAENLMARYFKLSPAADGIKRIIDDPDAVYTLVTEGIDKLTEIAEVYATDSFGKIRVRPPSAISLGVRVDSNLLQLDFNADEIDLAELGEILASYKIAKKYHRMRDGSFLLLEDAGLGSFAELSFGLDLTDEQLAAGHVELAPNRALYLDSICARNDELRINRDHSFESILTNMRDVDKADFAIPKVVNKVLRKYQKTGYRWMKTLDAYGFGGILADDMGLGKTVQVLALLEDIRERETGLPSMVICPSSLSLNWQSEAEKFTPLLKTAVIAGAAAERRELIQNAQNYDLLITSYDLLKRDIARYEGMEFEYIIIDEAQYIKNQSTQNAKAVKALDGKRRLALTGTPIENSLAELWSIFDFLMPGYLFTYSRFRKKYEEPITKGREPETMERLRRLVAPFMLRRLKGEVLKELPEKTESVHLVTMEDEQRKAYLATMAQMVKKFREDMGLSAGQEKIAILAALTRLRQICCDPSLIYENYSGGSAKLDACITLVESSISAGHRILLFSQFTSMLDIIEKKLGGLGIESLRIDGSTPSGSRLSLVNSFNAGTTPVFLISLKAGGTGLNLTGADIVIHYDPWWNLSAQNQATDRAHRIGQKNKVHVYKLIAKETLEERILDMQRDKAELADAIISENSSPFEKLNKEELLALLDMD